MNLARGTIKSVVELLNNGTVSDREKRVALTVAYSALKDIYGRETANAVLWAVAETCHIIGARIPPTVADRLTDLTA